MLTWDQDPDGWASRDGRFDVYEDEGGMWIGVDWRDACHPRHSPRYTSAHAAKVWCQARASVERSTA
jgi:hypothetical protein